MKRIKVILGLLVFLLVCVGISFTASPVAKAGSDYLDDFKFSGCDMSVLSNTATSQSNTKIFTKDPIVVYDLVYTTTSATAAGTALTTTLAMISIDIKDGTSDATTYDTWVSSLQVYSTSGRVTPQSLYPYSEPVILGRGLALSFAPTTAGTTHYFTLLYRSLK